MCRCTYPSAAGSGLDVAKIQINPEIKAQNPNIYTLFNRKGDVKRHLHYGFASSRNSPISLPSVFNVTT